MGRISFAISDGIIPFFYLGVRTGRLFKVFSFKRKEEFTCALFFLMRKYGVPARAVSLKDISKLKSILTSSSFKEAKEKTRGLYLLRFVPQKSFSSSDDRKVYDSLSGTPITPVEVSFLLKSLLLSPLPSLKKEELELLSALLKDCPKPKDYFVRTFSVKDGKLEEELTPETKEEDKSKSEVAKETAEEVEVKTKEEGKEETKETKEEVEKESLEGKPEKVKEEETGEREKRQEKKGQEKSQDRPLPSVRFSRVLTESFLKCSVKVSPIVSLWEVLLVDEEERELFYFLSSFFPKKEAFNVVALHGERLLKDWILSGFFSFSEELEKRKSFLTKFKKKEKLALKVAKEEETTKVGETEEEKDRKQVKEEKRAFFRKLFPFLRKETKTTNDFPSSKKETKETRVVRRENSKKEKKFSLGRRVEKKTLKDFFCKVLERRMKKFKEEGKRKASYVLHTICATLDCFCPEGEEEFLTLNFLNYAERLNRVLESVLGDTSLGNFTVNRPLEVKERLLSLSKDEEFLELFREEYRKNLNLWNSFLDSAIKFSEVKGEKASVEFFRKVRDGFPVVGELTVSDLLFSGRGRGRGN